MTNRIKFIWDFHGPNGKPTAEHHIKHLGEFVEAKNLQNTILGVEQITPNHHIAFLVVDKELMDSLRAILKPNRGQYYEEE
ncbi:hypothetical protein EI546_05055 [Aequorivita sp. H23M31]|uniref:DUF3303 domain-containing protein n=1 Tax=Aequorivita ciconiae TaxID=2494375 RepID=A0A410G1I1_9FLAO|nr:hypothetical protein [Aequorivita sp. H23M31]QAA81134.1 hypothetical protein EI546_05055 [Aequorivita sp. H23M31]